MSKHKRSESSASTVQVENAGFTLLDWLLDRSMYVHFFLFPFSHWAYTHQTAFSLQSQSDAIENLVVLLVGDGPSKSRLA